MSQICCNFIAKRSGKNCIETYIILGIIMSIAYKVELIHLTNNLINGSSKNITNSIVFVSLYLEGFHSLTLSNQLN